MDLSAEQIAELHAKAAKADKLEAILKDAQAQREAAIKIQHAYQRVKDKSTQAAEYLDALAAGKDPAPFWTEPASAPAEPEMDLDAPGSLAMFKGEMLKAIDQKLADLHKVVQARFESVAKPVLSMHRERATDSVRRWAAEKFPGFNWDEFQTKAAELAGSRKDLLEDEAGLQTLARAYWSDHADRRGYERAQQEHRARLELTGALVSPSFGTADRDVDGNPFEGIDATDMPGMFERMIQQDLARQSGGR